MFKKWYESEHFPGSRVHLQPLTGPYVLDLQRTNLGGDAVYRALRYCVMDWEHAPLLGQERFSEKYDPAAIDHLQPTFAIVVATEAMRMSSLTEDERKNS